MPRRNKKHLTVVLFFFQVGELQKLDGQVKELVMQSCQDSERLVTGKLKKETYITSEKNLTAKKQELITRIDNLLDAL